MNKTQELRLGCIKSSWNGLENHCQWCNVELPVKGRRRVWCSIFCQREFEANHVWRFARAKTRRRFKYLCGIEECTAERKNIQINHITPLVGSGYGISCAHHQENLEALCPPHHQVVTNAQRIARG